MAELYSSSKNSSANQGEINSRGNEFKGQLIATRQRNDNATRRLNRERSARSRLNARSRRNDSARTDELLQRILMFGTHFDTEPRCSMYSSSHPLNLRWQSYHDTALNDTPRNIYDFAKLPGNQRIGYRQKTSENLNTQFAKTKKIAAF